MYELRFPDTSTPFEADDTSAERRRAIILHTAANVDRLAYVVDFLRNQSAPFGEAFVLADQLHVGLGESAIALAVLAAVDCGWLAALPRDRGDPREIVNSFLRALVPWKVGTGNGSSGDWDMPLVNLVAIACRYSAYLSKETHAHLVDVLLDQHGPIDLDQLTKDYWLQAIPETENHVLMIEAARYLTNQLRGEDNEAVTLFLLNMLQGFLCFDFREYNARPYQAFSVRTITLLHDFAKDDRLRVAAWMVLDYLSAKFAASSNGLRRCVPFRRRAEYTDLTGLFESDADQESPRFLALTGMQKFYAVGDPTLTSMGGGDIGVPAVLSPYRPPLAMVDLMMNNQGKHYYQRFRHSGVELFASTPDFLISAGGIWMESGHGYDEWIGYKDCSIPLATVVMPSERGVGVDVSHFVRISGTKGKEWGGHGARNRINTGVAPGFTCGRNVNLPDRSHPLRDGQVPQDLLTAGDVRYHGPLILIDCTTLSKPQQHYLAVWREAVKGNRHVDNFGWVAVAPAGSESFDDFERNVVAAGGSGPFSADGLNHLAIAGMPPVFFTPQGDLTNKYLWPIRAQTGGWIDVSGWPLAWGNVMNSEGHSGVIHVDHPLFEVPHSGASLRSLPVPLGALGVPYPSSIDG